MENLWGYLSLDSVITPKGILEEQSKYLPDLTQNAVYAVVEQEDNLTINTLAFNNNFKKEFNYAFYVKSKFIPTYSYRAFSFSHDIELYPLYIKINDGIKSGIDAELHAHGFRNYGLSPDIPADYILISDENSFKEVLKIILPSQKMKQVLSSLISLGKK